MGSNGKCIDLSVFLCHRILKVLSMELLHWLSVGRDWARNVWKLPFGMSDTLDVSDEHEGVQYGFVELRKFSLSSWGLKNCLQLLFCWWRKSGNGMNLWLGRGGFENSASPLNVNWFPLPPTFNTHNLCRKMLWVFECCLGPLSGKTRMWTALRVEYSQP